MITQKKGGNLRGGSKVAAVYIWGDSSLRGIDLLFILLFILFAVYIICCSIVILIASSPPNPTQICMHTNQLLSE